MVPPDSHRVSRALWYSGSLLKKLRFRLRVFHPLWTPLPEHSTILVFLNADPTTPKSKLFGLGYCNFARRYFRNHFCFLFLQVLRWFNSLGSLVSFYIFKRPYKGFPHSDIPGSKPVWAAHRGLSQPTTSFIASRCLGIH